jgi:heat shock protein HslJ/uncharacterized protein YecT (DUF1311 family)
MLLGNAAAQTPMEDCAPGATDRSALIACLDQKLRQASLRLNAALKAAQDRVEKLEKENRRTGMSNFIDSQRKFNAYRDSNCTWQAVQAAPGSRGEEFVRDCQVRATLAREQELLTFVQGAIGLPAPAEPAASSPADVDGSAPVPAVTEVEEGGVSVTVTPPQPPQSSVASSPASETARRGLEWRLAGWMADGVERVLVPDSSVTISFDPSGKLAGNASVNRFNGQYRFNARGDLEWPRAGFAVTRMSGPPELMRQERAFLAVLRRTRHYRVEGERLVLESADGAVVLTFVR